VVEVRHGTFTTAKWRGKKIDIALFSATVQIVFQVKLGWRLGQVLRNEKGKSSA